MSLHVWLPYDDLGPLPEGVSADVYPGGDEVPASLERVEMYVVPYLQGVRPLQLIASMPRLRVVQTLTAGVDDVLPYVPDGVTVCNARGVHDASTAELAVALVLAALRGLPEFVTDAQRGHWGGGTRDSLADRTVLVVGHGSVGAAVTARLAGFECQVLAVARRARPGVAGLEELPSLLPQADVVVLTVPLTEQTRGMVDAGFLGAMPDGALLVNVARGPVVRTDDLVEQLRSGRLRAALDVTDPEPLPPDHPLWRLALVTPHVGGNSSAFLPRARRLIQDQVRRAAAGEPLLNVVTGPY